MDLFIILLKTDPTDGIMACCFMMEYVRTNLFLPGQVENWNLMIDLDNLGLTSVPYKVNKYYASRISYTRV